MSETWHGENIPGFRDVRRRLPIRTESLTQLGRGALHAEATVVSGPDATLYTAHVGGVSSSTLVDLNSEYTGIVVPITWRGEFVINGELVRPSSVYLPADETLFQAHGNERTTVAAALHRQNFIATVAALGGVTPDDVRLAEGALELAPAVMASARCSLNELFKQYADPTHQKPLPAHSAEQLSRRAAQILTELYLQAQPAKLPKIRTATKLARTVRKAEECFAAAQAGPVSLADLCVAAGVSQVTLYHAFMVMCGSSPIAYFKKRRLTDARQALLRSGPEMGLVKRAALGAGLTHLGRFSKEYHQLFGELPTTTLNLPSN